MKTEQDPPESSCARCGAAFICGVRAGTDPCWCARLPALVPIPGRACLCRPCLEEELRLAKRLYRA